jgi:Protein of unknown function (DUF559)
VTRKQLERLGAGTGTVARWITGGYLYPELPRTFAVGHPGRSADSDLFAAVLYAGPGAALDGLSAALHRGLVKWRTQDAIEVATPLRRRPLSASDPRNRLHREIVVRDRRRVRRAPYHGIPTVPVSDIVLSLSAEHDVDLVRFALAQMMFMRIYDPAALEAVCGPGIPGSETLRRALSRPQPRFARTRSPFEVKLIVVCEQTGIPLPEINEPIHVPGRARPITVDARWREEMVVLECDGEDNHARWEQRRRDAANDMALRGLGYAVLRYTSDRLDNAWAVYRDVMAQLEERRGRRTALIRAGRFVG